jgi:putative transposase
MEVKPPRKLHGGKEHDRQTKDVTLSNHVDYIHYNPVKHGIVSKPEEWEHGSFRKARENGWYPDGWVYVEPENCKGLEVE